MNILKYELKTKFKIANKGEQKDASFLQITAPANNVINHVSVLDREFNKALLSFSKINSDLVKNNKTDNEITEKDISGNELIMMLQAGGGDLKECYESLKSILLLTCFVDGQIQFTSSMFEKMDYQDTKALLGEYLKFFFGTFLDN